MAAMSSHRGRFLHQRDNGHSYPRGEHLHSQDNHADSGSVSQGLHSDQGPDSQAALRNQQ